MSYKTDAQLSTDNSNISTLGGVDSTKIEKVEFQAMVTNLIDSKRNLATWERGWYDVTKYGLVGDDSTNNTTALQILMDAVVDAGGGTLYFPPGIYRISSALSDTGNANAQVYFKAVALNLSTVVVNFVGASKPPNQLFTDSVLPNAGFSIIKSTITGAAGNSCCIGSKFSDQFTLLEQNNVCLNIFDMIFQAPANPTFTMLNCRHFQAGTYDGILIHAGNVNLDSIVEPTNTNAYGIKLPDYSHTPATVIGRLDVWGFYYGVRVAELCNAIAIRTWANKVGLHVCFAYHGNVFLSYGSYWEPTSIKSNGSANQLTISYFDVEDSNGNGQAWQDSVYNVDDAGNNITGEITYDVILGGFGRSSQWLQNGGNNLVCKRVGTTKLMKFTPANSTDATHAAGTVTVDDTYIYFRNSTGTWKKISWTTF